MSAEPLTDAEVDEFLAILPGSPSKSDVDALITGQWDPWADPLKRDHPHRSSEIDDLFRKFIACTTPILSAHSDAVVRGMVREMGRERVMKITRFIRADAARMQQLLARLKGAPPLSAQEVTELEGLARSYPSGFLELPRLRPTVTEQEALDAALGPCLNAHMAELERRGVLEDASSGRTP